MTVARRLSLALSVLTLAACAGHVPRTPAPAEMERGPLAARLLPPSHRTLNFVLSEPAYVTIFEIVPGRGVSVVYPAPFDVGADRPLDTGSHSVFAVPYNVGRWYYSDLPASVAATRPTYLYMIASREPLRIDEVLENPAALRRTVGFANFTQVNEQRTMDVLDARFVPRYLSDDAWASDWIELWPEPALAHPPLDARLVVPSCADGMVVVAIPGPTPGYICAPRDVKQQPRTPAEPGPVDSTATPPKSPPTEATPPAPAPRDGRRPNAPKQARAEPMTLAVDYGVPAASPPDGEREARSRSASPYPRPWERSGGRTSAMREPETDGARSTARGDRFARSGGPAAAGTAASSEHTATRSPVVRAEPRAEPAPAAAAPASARATSGGQ